ncbi:MAG: 2TM domain-containing protein [Flavobacteriaceae bacterium]
MDTYKNEERYFRAKKKVENIKGFYIHAFVYVVINVILLLLIYSAYDNKSEFVNLGTFSTALGWGIGLAIHALGVFGKDLIFGADWEERKMKEFLAEEESNSHKWE